MIGVCFFVIRFVYFLEGFGGLERLYRFLIFVGYGARVDIRCIFRFIRFVFEVEEWIFFFLGYRRFVLCM